MTPNPYIDPPTIPAGMTIQTYRHTRPKAPRHWWQRHATRKDNAR